MDSNVTVFNFRYDAESHTGTILELRNGVLQKFCTSCNAPHTTYAPSELQWEQFLAQLEYLDVWNWQYNPSDREYEDCYDIEFNRPKWSLEMVIDGKELVVSHRNITSSQFGQNYSPSFLFAVYKMTNGFFSSYFGW